MSYWRRCLLLCCMSVWSLSAVSETITMAAASDLRFALDDIVAQYQTHHGNASIRVIYGSSGKMTTQIRHGAPYDLFFSADIRFPETLYHDGFAVTTPSVYALGRIVLWSARHDVTDLSLEDLTSPMFRRIAIAQPEHAPYGMRAKEALLASGVWPKIEHKLVYGENIAQTAQMAESGAADVAIIALSLALFPRLAERGYVLIDESLHQPLTQGYVITRHGADNPLAEQFAQFMKTDTAHRIMQHYGFIMPSSDTHSD